MGFFDKLFKKKEEPSEVRSRENEPDVYNVPNEDERMNWAIEKAGLTLPYFQQSLQHPSETQQYFSIKARVEHQGKVEHIWLNDPTFDDDGNYYGTVGNEPIDVKNIKLGQKIGVDSQDVSDWMIIENGRLIGGYTIRAMREGLQGEDLENFDRSLGGIYVDEGEDYFPVDLQTPEGAILSIEDAYDSGDLDRALNCKNFSIEAELMLKSKFPTGINQTLIDTTAEALKLSFIKGITEHGMPKFGNIKRAFIRHKISDHHYVIDEICTYSDGSKSSQKLNVYRQNNEWKVLNPIN